jgi:choline dehydrogenase-like flavoprotein
MLVDAHSISDGSTITADACVVGAGPVGLGLACELEDAGIRVCLIESGSAGRSAEKQTPVAGEVYGDWWYPALAETRSRGLGGTGLLWNCEVGINRWGLRLGKLSEIDVERRAYVDRSGWPFGLSELEPFYERVSNLWGLGAYDTDPTVAGTRPLLLASFEAHPFRFGLKNVITDDVPSRIERSDQVTCFVNAHVLEVEANEDGTAVTGLRAATAPGRAFRVRARVYVLALGGIENPRLLLLSRTQSVAGLGNAHDLVGRFFMDHPTAMARLTLSARGVAGRLGVYDVQDDDGRIALRGISPTADVQRRERLLNSCGVIVPDIERERRALEAAGAWSEALRHRHLPEHAARKLWSATAGTGAIAAASGRKLARRVPDLVRVWPRLGLVNTHGIGPIAGWSKLPRAATRFRTFELFHVLEQTPEPERRITLGSERDDFGRPLPRLHWTITERELDSMRRTQEILANDLARDGVGKLETTSALAGDGDILDLMFPTEYHHIGTTRMDADPRQGVVDATGRVHGLSNLYIAGTSTFPTGGHVNPTLTAVALALRLGASLGRGLRALPETESVSQ